MTHLGQDLRAGVLNIDVSSFPNIHHTERLNVDGSPEIYKIM